MAVQATYESAQADLRSYFDKSASAVRIYSDRFEQAYIRPAVKASLESFDTNPISSTFIAIFSLLSFLPIISFIGFSLFAVASVTFVTLSCAFIVSIIIEITLVSLLLSALTVLLFLSTFLTTGTITAYLTFRLVSLIRTDGRAGVSEWTAEAQRRFVRGKAPSALVLEGEKSHPSSPLIVERNLDETDAVHDKSWSSDEGVKVEGADGSLDDQTEF